jgi:hypothetical protein
MKIRVKRARYEVGDVQFVFLGGLFFGHGGGFFIDNGLSRTTPFFW